MTLAPHTLAKLVEGARELNEGRWWEAHEAWEEAWLEEEGEARLWLQGLIQLAAAYHKGLRMGNPRGMATLFARCLEKLDRIAALDPAFGGVDMLALCEAAREGQAKAERWAAGQATAFECVPVRIVVRPPIAD